MINLTVNVFTGVEAFQIEILGQIHVQLRKVFIKIIIT